MPYTRITEYKHLTGQSHAKTSITYEYPSAEGDPYYPIPRPENQALFKKYEALADSTPGVTFVGRLATYRYYNMDQVVGQALAAFRRLDAARQVEGRRQPRLDVDRGGGVDLPSSLRRSRWGGGPCEAWWRGSRRGPEVRARTLESRPSTPPPPFGWSPSPCSRWGGFYSAATAVSSSTVT